MEKIITITQNNKTYTPTQVSKQTSIIDSVVNYNPSLTEKIIGANYDGFLITDLGYFFVTDNGDLLTYGE